MRYHLSDLPTDIDPSRYRLTTGDHVERSLSLSLTALKRDSPVLEIVAVNQCSGKQPWLSNPRAGGGRLGNGAMGNARWTGIPLRALLDRAGVRPEAQFWKGSVTRMVKVYGAPIEQQHAYRVAAYLGKAYGGVATSDKYYR